MKLTSYKEAVLNNSAQRKQVLKRRARPDLIVHKVSGLDLFPTGLPGRGGPRAAPAEEEVSVVARQPAEEEVWGCGPGLWEGRKVMMLLIT